MSRRCLVIVAHADDETLMCGGFLARLKSTSEWSSTVYCLSGGGQKRESNLPGAGDLLGFDSIVGPLTASNMTLDRETVTGIDDMILAVGPDLVITHSLSDHQNQDHNVVHRATTASLSRLAPSTALLSGEPTYPDPGFSPTVFVNISSTLDAKVQAAAAYAGESYRPYFSKGFIEARAAWWGKAVDPDGQMYCEAFRLAKALV